MHALITVKVVSFELINNLTNEVWSYEVYKTACKHEW